MSKFKDGDKVETLTSGGYQGMVVGAKGTVVGAGIDGGTDVNMGDDLVLFFYDEEVKLTD